MADLTIEELRSLLRNHITVVPRSSELFCFPEGSRNHSIFPIQGELAWSYTVGSTTILNHPKTTIERENVTFRRVGDYCFLMPSNYDKSLIVGGQLEMINPNGTTLTNRFPKRVELIQEASDEGFIARMDNMTCFNAITGEFLSASSTGFTITQAGERLYQDPNLQDFCTPQGPTAYSSPFKIEPRRILLEDSVWLMCSEKEKRSIVNPNTEEVRRFPVEIDSPTVFTVDGRSCFVGGGYDAIPRSFYNCETTEKVMEIPDPVIPHEMSSFAGRPCIRFDTNVEGLDGIKFWYHEERGTHIKRFSS